MDDYGGTCLVGDGGGRRLEWASNGDVEEGDGATQVGGGGEEEKKINHGICTS